MSNISLSENYASASSGRQISINSQIRIQFIPKVTKGPSSVTKGPSSVTKGSSSVTKGSSSVTKGPHLTKLITSYEEDDDDINVIYPSTK